jgi:hypothetical protein
MYSISYEALGLVHTLNPVAQGGSEKNVALTKAEPVLAPVPTSVPSSSKPRPQGYGRIIRDEKGAVIGVELPVTEEDDSRISHTKGKGKGREIWGDAMDDSDEEAEKMIPSEASGWLKIGSNEPKEDSSSTGLGISRKKGRKELVHGMSSCVNVP